MNIIKSRRKPRQFLVMIACLAILQIFPSVQAAAFTQTIMTPHALSSGSEQDLLKANTYRFTSDGKQLIRLDVPQKGAVVISLYVQKGAFINTEVHTKADGSDLPVYLRAQCTADRGNQGIMTLYMDKGTYYLCFPKNTYQADVLLYPSRNQTLKDSSVIAAYCDYRQENTYSYKALSDGYITVSQTPLSDLGSGSMTAVLYNSKGTKLTENAIFSDEQKGKISYAVKKGTTYKLKVKALNVNDTQYYQLKLKHTAVNEKSGSSKKKAVDVKFGNKISGTVFAEDSATKADWYKIKNPKKQQLVLNYSGSITSGSLIIEIFDTKGKKLDSFSVISNIGEKKENLMHNKDGGTKMPEGTYYLKITKSRKSSTGIYSFSVYGK